MSGDVDTNRMSTRERPIDRGRRLAARDRSACGAEIRTARLILGRSLEVVGRAAGMSASSAGRIERGAHPAVTHEQLVALGAAVGLDVRTRSYPGQDGLLDAGQGAMIRDFHGRLHPSADFSTEWGLPGFGDQRAWDAMIQGLTGTPDGVIGLPVEFETRFVDEQAQTRRIMLKLRDSGLPHVILVVAGTDRNRAALRAASPGLRERFPLNTREVMKALGDGRYPDGSGLVLL
jgi:transcriptional regulator with XRE-family HTH domain